MNIISKPTVTIEQCRTWIKGVKTANKLAVQNIDILYNAAVKRGIEPSILISQCMIETGWFNFGGVLNASYHNTCGLKTNKGGSDKAASAHMKFKNWEEGINAHADHLALYAGAKGFPKYSPNCSTHLNTKYKGNGTTQDPRHFPYLLGTCKTVESLEGKWATSKGYADKILKLVKQIQNTKVSNVEKPKTLNKHKDGNYNRSAIITASSLNVRKGRPGSNEYKEILGRLKKGEKVIVWYCLNNWFSISYNGKTAYICGDYVEIKK